MVVAVAVAVCGWWGRCKSDMVTHIGGNRFQTRAQRQSKLDGCSLPFIPTRVAV